MIYLLGFIGIILMNASAIPQLIKTYKTKKVRDMTIWRESMLLSGVIFYLTYGIMRKDIVIITSNIWASIMFISLVIMILKYKKLDIK